MRAGTTHSRRWAAIVATAAFCLIAATIPALAEAPPAAEGDVLARATSPRGAVEAFLEATQIGDYQHAATLLDFQGVPPSQAKQAPQLATQLRVVLDRALWIDPARLSDSPEGDLDDGLPRNRELVGTIQMGKTSVDVLLTRTTQPDGTPRWKFAGSTVAKIPALYAEFGYGPFAEYLPRPLVERRFLDVALWQWIGLFALVPIAWLIAWVTSRVALAITQALLRRFRPHFDRELLRRGLTPVRMVIGVLAFAAGTRFLALSLRVQHVFGALELGFVIVAITWVLLRAVDVVAEHVSRRLIRRQHFSAASVVPLARRTVKVVVATIALSAMLENVGYNVTGVIAALGVGGLAVALAAQKTVENLFGGLTLIADQPVRVGDVCRFGERTGTVEDIGLRSTRLRTPERTMVSIPNATFAGMELENFRYRDRLSWRTTVGLPYGTSAEQIRSILADLTAMLRGLPDVDAPASAARLVGLGQYAIEIEVSFSLRTTDGERFTAAREDVLLRIMDTVAAHGTRLALPAQMVYAATPGGDANGGARASDEGPARATAAASPARRDDGDGGRAATPRDSRHAS